MLAHTVQQKLRQCEYKKCSIFVSSSAFSNIRIYLKPREYEFFVFLLINSAFFFNLAILEQAQRGWASKISVALSFFSTSTPPARRHSSSRLYPSAPVPRVKPTSRLNPGPRDAHVTCCKERQHNTPRAFHIGKLKLPDFHCWEPQYISEQATHFSLAHRFGMRAKFDEISSQTHVHQFFSLTSVFGFELIICRLVHYLTIIQRKNTLGVCHL